MTRDEALYSILDDWMFENSNEIKHLDLSDLQFTEVPVIAYSCPNIISLNLSHNKLTSLPPEIGNLQKLSVLDLRHNPISPEEEEKIKQLLPNCKRIYFT